MTHYSPKPPVRWWPNKFWLQAVLVVTLAILIIFIAYINNAFGRNLTGEVECQNAKVVGVTVLAEHRPDLQSGEAKWMLLKPTSDRAAKFTYWLPLGGRYTLVVKCGLLSSGQPESENATLPWYDADSVRIRCNNPRSPKGQTVKAACVN